MNKTVASVIDDINEWENPRGGSVFYVTAIFTDESVGSVGRKDHDAALEVQGLLREAIGREQDFVLEPKGQTKGGRDKFKILGFGTPGGAATYTAPGADGLRREFTEATKAMQAKSDELLRDVPNVARRLSGEQASIRASVALKAAVDACHGLDINAILEYADAFNVWMLEKTSEPALSEYPQPVVAASSEPSTDHQAGVDSEDSSVPGSVNPGAESEGGVESEGKEPAPPSHEHDWQLRQGVRGFLVCDACGATRKKETAG